MAAMILSVNGLEAALEFVAGMPDSRPPMEAAFEFHLEELEQRREKFEIEQFKQDDLADFERSKE